MRSVIPALVAWASLILEEPAGALTSGCRPLRVRLSVAAHLSLIIGTLGIALMTAQAAEPALTPGVSAYQTGPRSEDGIGKFYEGREIAQIMGYAGASWLERPTRKTEERTDILLQELRLARGMVVADIGAGSGFLSRQIGPQIAPATLYAVDVQPQMVAMLKNLATQPGMLNLVPVLGAVNDVNLPAGVVDVAVLVDVYHELEFPLELMRSVVRSLKPGGRVVFVEYRGEDPQLPIKPLHKMTQMQVRREMRALLLVWERTNERLPLQHVIVFRKIA